MAGGRSRWLMRSSVICFQPPTRCRHVAATVSEAHTDDLGGGTVEVQCPAYRT